MYVYEWMSVCLSACACMHVRWCVLGTVRNKNTSKGRYKNIFFGGKLFLIAIRQALLPSFVAAVRVIMTADLINKATRSL